MVGIIINFDKMIERKDDHIIKFEDIFLNQLKDLILIKTTAMKTISIKNIILN